MNLKRICISVEKIGIAFALQFFFFGIAYGQLTLNQSILNHPCQNTENGSIFISFTGGNGPVTVSWNEDTALSSTEITNLSAGFYTLFLEDSAGNTLRDTFELIALDTAEISVNFGSNFKAHFCANEPALTLDIFQSTAGAGQYFGTGVVSNIFYPSDSIVGEIQIHYEVQNANNCISRKDTSVHVTALPIILLEPFPQLCFQGDSVVLSQGSAINQDSILIPGIGVYSGTGIQNDSVFNPKASGIGAGSYTIAYQFTDTFNCSANLSGNLLVAPLPNVTLNAIPSICEDESNFTLPEGSPGGGYFKPLFDGALNQILDSSGNLQPIVLGDTNLVVTYIYTNNQTACTSSDSTIFTINPLPQVSLNAVAPICSNANSFQLTGGQPTGGTYSVNGVNAMNFYPDTTFVGVNTLVYSFTDNNQCTNTDTTDLIVNPLPIVALNLVKTIYCKNDPIDTLTGGTANVLGTGIYSGDGVSNDSIFDPNASTLINPTITFTFIDTATGCINEASENVSIYNIPLVSFGAIPSVCDSTDTFAITSASPPNGYYTGLGVVDSLAGIVNPAIAGPGTHTLTYVFQTSNGCEATASSSYTVHPLPNAGFSALSDVCADAGSVNLQNSVQPTTGISGQGTFFGTGISGNLFNPQISGVGNFTMNYTFTDNNGCKDTASSNIVVNALPLVGVQFTQTYCVGGERDTLRSGTPVGGVYSGNGISQDSIFNPFAVGTYPISYFYVDSNNCAASASANIDVNGLPNIAVRDTFLCLNDDSLSFLPLANPAGGVFSNAGQGFNISSGFFNPAARGVGASLIEYTITDNNNCSNNDYINIVVQALPITEFRIEEDNVCKGFPASITYTGQGISYLWSTGETSRTINFNPISTDFYSITATSASGCQNVDSVELRVLSGLDIDAVKDSIITPFNTSVEYDPLANDIGNVFSINVLSGPFNGNLEEINNPFFRYVPNLDFRRVDSVVYEICDAKCFDVCDTSVWIINVLGDPRVFIPKGFSPNGDGINDYFVVPGIELFPDNEFVVFTRTGEPIFEARPYTNNWTGQINAGFLTTGSRVPDGTYFYFLKLNDGTNEQQNYSGYIEVRTR